MLNKQTRHNKYAIYSQPFEDRVISKLIDKNARLTTENLNPVEDLTPRIADTVSSAKSQWNHSKNALSEFLRGNSSVVSVDAMEVTWKLAGVGFFHAKAGPNINANNPYVGYQHELFDIKLDVDWYGRADILTALLGKEDFNVRVEDGPIPDGAGYYIYKVRLSGDYEDYLDQAYLEEGQIWMKLGAISGEATRDRGSSQLMSEGATWVEFRNRLNHYSKKLKVTDEALYAGKLSYAFGFDVDSHNNVKPNGQLHILPNAEAEVVTQAEYEKDLLLTYGRGFSTTGDSRVLDNSSSYPLDSGDGLFPFLKEGNVISLSPSSYAIDQLIGQIDEIWDQRVPFDQRQLVIFTGSGGLKWAEEYARRELNSQGVLTHYQDITSPGATTYAGGYEGRTLKTSYITEFQFYPWGRAKFQYLPLLDDRQLNTGALFRGKPLSSYAFIVLDVGFGSGRDSNVKLLKRSQGYNWSYVCGTVSPLGPINNMNNKTYGGFSAAHTGAWYELVHDDYFGLIVEDTARTLWGAPAFGI